jgi:hypothetical protein
MFRPARTRHHRGKTFPLGVVPWHKHVYAPVLENRRAGDGLCHRHPDARHRASCVLGPANLRPFTNLEVSLGRPKPRRRTCWPAVVKPHHRQA